MSEPHPDPDRAARPQRLWLLEDGPGVGETTIKLAGSLVETFADGMAVVAAATREAPPDVLLLAWSAGGEAALRGLRANAATASLPILVLTGAEDEVVEALSEGATDVVSRACSGIELRTRVAGLVRLIELRRRAESAERVSADLLARERVARPDVELTTLVDDDFLATLSHDLRTPLHTILGWVALLRAGSLAPEAAERALATIERSGRAQATMIEDLVDVSRIVGGKMSLDVLRIDPRTAAKHAVETVRTAAASKKVELVSRMESVGFVDADAARVEQAVRNLLRNAVREAPTGGRVILEVLRASDGVSLRVTHTGGGAASASFDGRLTPAPERRQRFGIGLEVARRIAELHGGTFGVSIAGDEGTTLEVTLPRGGPGTGAAVRPSSESDRDASAASLEGVRVLVVDDDPDSLELACAALRSAGAAVRPARSAGEALQALDDGLPDVIASDIMMPDMDGIALLRAIRERPVDRGGGLPVVALTAAASPSDRERILSHGFHWHLAKPIDLGVLVGTVGRLAADPR